MPGLDFASSTGTMASQRSRHKGQRTSRGTQFTRVGVRLSVSLSENLCAHFTLTQCTPDFRTCSQKHHTIRVDSSYATKQGCICHGSGASLSDATAGNARKSPRPSTRPRQQRRSVNRYGHLAAFQQQLRQEMTDVIQQLRIEVNETVSDRTDMMNSIDTAL